MRRLVVATSLLLAAGCGDVARLEVDLRFPSGDVQEQIQQLLFVVRQAAESGDPCDPLWGTAPANLGQYARLVNYPNAADLVVAPLKVDRYTVFVYGLPTRLDVLCEEDADCTSSGVGTACRAIAGGQRACMPPEAEVDTLAGCCGQNVVEASATNQLLVVLEPPPG
jgi:tetrahydromethanopterin S-methyltransferase subunit B